MRILFLFQKFSFSTSTIYLDLVRECAAKGHRVLILAGNEGKNVGEELRDGCRVAYVPLPDQFHSGKIKKGLIQLMIGRVFVSSLKKHFWSEKVDIIVYPTPPITLADVVKKAKVHFGARTYLMLKDIFPQNAVDLGMMREGSLLHRYFRRMEKKLYEVSDAIGCMSEANVRYVAAHNPETLNRLELFPNTVRIKEDVPQAVSKGGPVRFIIGGNLGEPQALDVIMEGIRLLHNDGFTDAYFVIVGDGTKRDYVKSFVKDNSLSNISVHDHLPREEYENLLMEQDVGIISLSFRFSVPNFPSRLLSYMQISKPVLVVADTVTDVGDVVENRAGCGFFVTSEEPLSFAQKVREICRRKNELPLMGRHGRTYLEENYNVAMSVNILVNSCNASR